jgi:hypothetical protein
MPRSYGDDVLAARRARRTPAAPVEVAARRGVRIEHAASRFAGVITAIERGMVTLRDDRGGERVFAMRPGAFRVDGRAATLVLPRRAPGHPGPTFTASGSVAGDPAPAKVARASRIWVEGIHDAELLEKVWGDDLRETGIVVEPLGGIDDLAAAVRAFGPAGHRRLGVLVDHLVAGSKEQRIAVSIRDPHVLITGHPYVDVWAGVRPRTVGLRAWPEVPRGRPWKEGVCAALGVGEPAAFWRRLLGSVRSYADLEQPLVGAVEQLLDFVTAADEQRA